MGGLQDPLYQGGPSFPEGLPFLLFFEHHTHVPHNNKWRGLL